MIEPYGFHRTRGRKRGSPVLLLASEKCLPKCSRFESFATRDRTRQEGATAAANLRRHSGEPKEEVRAINAGLAKIAMACVKEAWTDGLKRLVSLGPHVVLRAPSRRRAGRRGRSPSPLCTQSPPRSRLGDVADVATIRDRTEGEVELDEIPGSLG